MGKPRHLNEACRWCGGVGKARDLRRVEHRGHALELCSTCRGRLRRAVEGDPDWTWMLSALERQLDGRRP